MLNRPLANRLAIRSACSTSNVSRAFSTSATMSPMPRIRPATRSASKVSSASIFSPRPTKRIGLPVTARIDSAAPPRPSPSIRVSTTPEMPTLPSNSEATLTASWPGQTIDNQQHLTRLGDVAHGLNFVHQHFVDVQPARSVEEQHVVAAHRRLQLGPLGNLHRRLALDDGQAVDADLPGQNRQLLHSGRAVGVQGRQQHPLAVALFQPLGQLGGGRRLTRALQTDHQNGRRRVVDLQRLRARHRPPEPAPTRHEQS